MAYIGRNEELYLFHEDNAGSYVDVRVGDKMYFTAYTSKDLVVDGYNARVGTPNQFEYKYTVDFEMIESDIVEYEGDGFEVIFGRILKVYDGGGLNELRFNKGGENDESES